jgi:signal recognition particle receptor subunit beta
MVQINMAAREITLKLVYYGPALSGKTTNLQKLHEMLDGSSRGKMVTLDTTDDRTLYFDFLPVTFGTQSGFAVKLKLFTVPGQVMHKSTRKVVLAGADAVAFVADSQRSSASANAYSWRDMEANLKSNGIDFEAIPIRELLRLTYRQIDAKHQFAEKFSVSEEDFLKGVLQNLNSPSS